MLLIKVLKSAIPLMAGKRKDTNNSLKITAEDEEENDAAQLAAHSPMQSPTAGSHSVITRDAKTINVFRGAHAVVLMVDPQKKWTFDYAQRELPKIPSSISVLLVVFCTHKTITENFRQSISR